MHCIIEGFDIEPATPWPSHLALVWALGRRELLHYCPFKRHFHSSHMSKSYQPSHPANLSFMHPPELHISNTHWHTTSLIYSAITYTCQPSYFKVTYSDIDKMHSDVKICNENAQIIAISADFEWIIGDCGIWYVVTKYPVIKRLSSFPQHTLRGLIECRRLRYNAETKIYTV